MRTVGATFPWKCRFRRRACVAVSGIFSLLTTRGTHLVFSLCPSSNLDHTLPVKIKIHQSGNSTAFVDKVLLTLRTCQVDTWALSHARTLNQRREVDGCRGDPSTQDDWVAAGASEDVAGIRTGNLLRQNSDMKAICIGEPFDETYKREKEELEARYRQVARRHHNNNESFTEYDALEVDLYM
jgi:hypothetical protein